MWSHYEIRLRFSQFTLLTLEVIWACFVRLVCYLLMGHVFYFCECSSGCSNSQLIKLSSQLVNGLHVVFDS